MEHSASDPEAQQPRRPQPEHDDGHRHGMAYFLPGQVMLFVEHDPRHDAAWIVEQTQSELRALAGDQDRYCPSTVNQLIKQLDKLRDTCDQRSGAVLTYPLPKQRERLKNARAASSLFVDLSESHSQRRIEDQEMIRLFDYLNRRIIARPPARSRDPLILRAASPNWLASGAQPGITGGPGARPVPATDVPTSGVLGSRMVSSAAHEIKMWEFVLPFGAGQASATAQSAGQDVEVVILDTAPPPTAFDQVSKHSLHHHHPLLHAMLRADGSPRHGPPHGLDSAGKLSISYANTLGIDMRLPEPYYVDNHDYEMSDHGLFVAGIINSIAPRAKLHLIEILNSQGVGTLQWLLQALQYLIERQSSTPLVVNCSLMINMPLPGHPRKDFDWPTLEMDCRLIDLLTYPAQYVYDLLRTRLGKNVRVVAAAGNDAEKGRRPQARLPAALNKVIGVGALDTFDQPASYSNLSDRPLRAGLMTFGGTSNGEAADAETGMLGTYIGKFPPSDGHSPAASTPEAGSAPTGWARWAGTSFAAPVISGTLAMLVSQGGAPNFDVAEQMLRAVVEITELGEEKFEVQQGVAQPAAQNVPA